MSNVKITKQQLRQALEKEISERSLFEFFKLSTKVLYPSVDWDYNWHYEYLCDVFQNEVERINNKQEKEKDYLINLPFRSGKSTLISVIFPVWCWIKNPAMQVITVSATDTLAVKFSHQSKMLIESDWFKERFGDIFQLRVDSHAKGKFMTDKGGLRQSFGITSTIIGSGGDILICDDLNNPQKVSDLALNNVTETYNDVLYSRVNQPGISLRIILAQRVHENDISGYLMRNNPEKYFHICIPVKLTKVLSPFHLSIHYDQGLFWKSRFSNKEIDNYKTTLSATAFSGQLEQLPVPAEGNVIKRAWFVKKKWSEVMDLKLKWDLFLDTAFTDKTKNDPSGFLVAAKWGNHMIIRRAARRWLKFYELIEEVKEWHKVYDINRVFVEDKSSGISIIQELRRQTKFNVIKTSPKSKDKVERVNAVQPIIEGERVIIIVDEWNETFLVECAAFPFATHDDLVDCLSYAIERNLQGGGGVTIRRA